MSEQNVSSAEITAYMRSQEPILTHDHLSAHLVSPEGIQKYHDFVDGMNYPLATRKIMVRAGYFYEQALSLLESGQYDSCISFASGFSLLTYFLAKAASKSIKFYDTDLENILLLRNQRIQEKRALFDANIIASINNKVLDISTLSTCSLQEVFPDCKRPLFIIEGLTYFLDRDTVTILLQQIMRFEKSAVILDYWPENSLEISAIFKRTMQQLKGFIAEDLKSFLIPKKIDLLREHYPNISDISILDVDALLSKKNGQNRVLIDQNDVFPIRILIAQ